MINMVSKSIRSLVVVFSAVTGSLNPALAAHNQPVSTPPHSSNNSAPYVVPYQCGSDVSSKYVHGSLIVVSDPNADAGFDVYSSQTTTKVPFAPGQISFSVSGAHNGDQVEVVEFDVNGRSNGTVQYLNNGVFSVNLQSLTHASINEIFVGFSTTSSTLQLSAFKLNKNSLPVDLTQTATCSK